MQYVYIPAFILRLTDGCDDPSEAAARAVFDVSDSIRVIEMYKS